MGKKGEEKFVSARIDPELVKEMKHFCIDHGLSVKAFLERAIAEKLGLAPRKRIKREDPAAGMRTIRFPKKGEPNGDSSET